MSLTSSASSLSPSLTKFTRDRDRYEDNTPFHHSPTYITLTRTLTRLSNILLPLSTSLSAYESPSVGPTADTDSLHLPVTEAKPDLTHDQRRLLGHLLSPLPYYRARYQHTIEHARTLLLQLEQSAQGIKVQRMRREAVQDLEDKRKVVRSLKAVVEEAGREAERRIRDKEQGLDADYSDDYDGETVEELLGLPPLQHKKRDSLGKDGGGRSSSALANGANGVSAADGVGRGKGSPTSDVVGTKHPFQPPQSQFTTINHGNDNATTQPPTSTTAREQESDLFNLRHRRPNPSNPAAHRPTSTSTTTTTTPLPPPPDEEQPGTATTTTTTSHLLHSDRQTQESLTTNLLSLASQLKSQSTGLSHHLATTDKTALDRALAGLDANVSGLEAASRRMGFLNRMSEGQGLWGRTMLYVWIAGLWLAVVGLVMLGPKFRF